MQSGATFAEVLEQTLGAFQPTQAAPDNRRHFQQAPPHPFLFSPRYDRVTWAAAGARFGAPTAARVGTSPAAKVGAPFAQRAAAAKAAAPVAVGPATPHRLTTVQRRSLDAFIRSGATMGADFSAPELRSAFRTLARRYHPDRHPFADQSEKASLSRQFTALTTNHQILLTALESPRN